MELCWDSAGIKVESPRKELLASSEMELAKQKHTIKVTHLLYVIFVTQRAPRIKFFARAVGQE
jgi:hypothetical protein